MKHIYLLFLTVFTIQTVEAQIVNIPDANFKNALVNTNCTRINGSDEPNADIDTNNDGEIQVSEAEAVTYLNVSNQNIASLEGIEAFINLGPLYASNNQLSSLDLSGLNDLHGIAVGHNFFTSLKDITFPDYTHNLFGWIDIAYNQLTTIEADDVPTNLDTFRCNNNQITSINLDATNILNNFYSSNNPLISLTLPNSNLIEHFEFNNTALTELKLKGHGGNVNCSNNPNLISVDLASFHDDFTCENNPVLETISFKNGIFNTSGFGSDGPYNYSICNNPNLSFVCADEGEIENKEYIEYGETVIDYGIKQLLDDCGYTNVAVSSYCTFEPGGNLNIVQGSNVFDSNNDGCDVGDSSIANLKYNISYSNGTIYGSFTSDDNGDYVFYVGDYGTHTITPDLENSEYYTITPENFSVNFQTDTSPFTQDFCIVPNGTHNDLDIAIIPLEAARPGFDTNYKITYKNKGTTTLSGIIDLMFQDDLMDLIASTPVALTQTLNNLSWNYTNIAPFETGEILFTMNLNSPMETPAINGDDVLAFTATINPTIDDETPEDNVFAFNQTVVNSYDPNDKTCLEGNTITPDLIGEFVNYLIRFENTGTADAIHVVVKDFIDLEKFDISTFFLKDSSHDVVTKISNNNLVEFIFEDINLPYDDANNDGYIAFKIKTLPTLVEGDIFENEAEIYFDYNFPIITNKAQTSINSALSTHAVEQSDTISLFPNPVQDHITITSKNAIEYVLFYDITGRLVSSISFTKNQIHADLSTKELKTGHYFVKVKTSLGEQVLKITKR